MGSRKVQGKKRSLEVLQLLRLRCKFSVGLPIGKILLIVKITVARDTSYSF